MRIRKRDRGAAAVEFALLLPLLIALVCGIVEFSRAYNAQATISGAARVVARDVALGNQQQAQRDLDAYLSTLNSQYVARPTIPSSCPTGSSVTITIGYAFPLVGDFFGRQYSVSLTGTGVMPCDD